MTLRAFTGARVFDGKRLVEKNAVLIDGDLPQILPEAGLPRYCERIALPGGTLMPGFVDLQVNGGGGVMLGDDPSLDTLRRIARAHRDLGTRAFLPTLITDTPERTRAAIAAVQEAVAARVPGVLGLHLEGPHLDPARAGAHDPALIRPMTAADLDMLLDAGARLPNLMVTLAPEAASGAQIAALAGAGVIVALGHSDASAETARAAFVAGARAVTHLFNAMSQLDSRAPGLVGATLAEGGVAAGLIADGVHVHSLSIRAALAAKRGPGTLFLVTDAMAVAGTDLNRFDLGGRRITRASGRLTLEDGTLAGADLTMGRALQVMIEEVGDAPDKALARATSIPAGLLRDPGRAGRWPDRMKDLIHLGDDYRARPASAYL